MLSYIFWRIAFGGNGQRAHCKWGSHTEFLTALDRVGVSHPLGTERSQRPAVSVENTNRELGCDVSPTMRRYAVQASSMRARPFLYTPTGMCLSPPDEFASLQGKRQNPGRFIFWNMNLDIIFEVQTLNFSSSMSINHFLDQEITESKLWTASSKAAFWKPKFRFQNLTGWEFEIQAVTLPETDSSSHFKAPLIYSSVFPKHWILVGPSATCWMGPHPTALKQPKELY